MQCRLGPPKEVVPSVKLPDSSASKTTGRPQQLGFCRLCHCHPALSISSHIKISSLLSHHIMSFADKQRRKKRSIDSGVLGISLAR